MPQGERGVLVGRIALVTVVVAKMLMIECRAAFMSRFGSRRVQELR